MFTYGGPDGNAFNLNDSIAGVMKDATVQGYEMILRSRISVGAISRSLKGGKAAFENASKLLVQNMLKSMTKRLETQLLYGQTHLALAATVAAGPTFTIAAKEWAPGIWAGSEGMKIDFFDGTTHIHTTTVVAVNFDTKTVTTSTADLDAAGVDGGDSVHFFGSRDTTSGAYNEFVGIDKIISQTSGNLFGIPVSSYSLWKGNVLSNGGGGRDLTLALIEDAVEKAVAKGLVEQDVVALVNPASWNKLLTEQTAKRQFDSSYKSDVAEAGHSKIVFFGQNGKIAVVPSIYCKQGSAYILCLEEFMRVGSRDISFDLPGFEGEFVFALENAHGYEMRCYTDQALMCTAPAKLSVLRDVEGA